MDLHCPICWFVTSDNRGPFNNSSCKVGSTFLYEVLELRLGVLWEQTCSILGMCSVFSLLLDCKLCQDSNHSVFISAFQESSAMLATQKVLDKRVQMVKHKPHFPILIFLISQKKHICAFPAPHFEAMQGRTVLWLLSEVETNYYSEQRRGTEARIVLFLPSWLPALFPVDNRCSINICWYE